MTGNGWLSIAKSTLLKSGTIGTVSVVGLWLGTPEKDQPKTAPYYPYCFALTSGLYAVNDLALQKNRYLIQDMSQPWILRTIHTILAFPRKVLMNPSVAVPVAFGTGYFFFPLAFTYLIMDNIKSEADKDRRARKRDEEKKG